MLDYVKFDVINDIFYIKNNSCIKLIKNIYEALEPDMNTSPQFKHQRAKSILWLLENNFDEILKAIDYINLSYYNTKTLIEKTNNRFLKISLGHISYTRALLYGRKCSIEGYSDEENIKSALLYYQEALFNPINKDELDTLRSHKADRRIIDDLKKIIDYIFNADNIDLEISIEAQMLCENLNWR